MKNIRSHSRGPSARRKLAAAFAFAVCAALVCASSVGARNVRRLAPEVEYAFAQQGNAAERANAERTYPLDVRGDRVERATV